MPKEAKADLASLWKARAIQVADADMDRNLHEVTWAWDGDRLLLETLSRYQPGESWRQTRYWDGKQGWIGETSVSKAGESKTVYRSAHSLS
jgi:SH3-like domain-containing protein